MYDRIRNPDFGQSLILVACNQAAKDENTHTHWPGEPSSRVELSARGDGDMRGAGGGSENSGLGEGEGEDEGERKDGMDGF